ncbi:hypothetical protein Defa_15940 [Desulfovibrio sp. TH_2024_36128]|uniref:Uncharacterized protein n=1 Tax=Desulfovibrio falkowii TaxID=3136602 RepID=A0ABQ0E975_9BACT
MYHGKTEVTHKALSPLRTLHAKLTGLSFVQPHVAPVADIVQAALLRIPKKGNITGPDLLLLQGLVCLLKDSQALIAHAQRVVEGNAPDFVLDALLAGSGSMPDLDGITARLDSAADVDDTPILSDLPVADSALPQPSIPSLGLW